MDCLGSAYFDPDEDNPDWEVGAFLKFISSPGVANLEEDEAEGTTDGLRIAGFSPPEPPAAPKKTPGPPKKAPTEEETRRSTTFTFLKIRKLRA